MAEVYAFLADGLEEVECLAAVDVLIRGGVSVKLISISDKRDVTGSHGFRITADAVLDEVDLDGADVYFLPGGMPGTTHLGNCKKLCDALVKAEKEGKRLAAICAAPSVFGELGLLNGKKATCYPGFEKSLKGASHTSQGVVTDGAVTTARGLGYALDLGIELLSLLTSRENGEAVKAAIQYDQH